MHEGHSHDDTDRAFDRLLKRRLAELRTKQAEFERQAFGLRRWEYDLDQGVITFRSRFRKRIYPIIPIGTYVATAQQWLWAWANSSFPAAAQERARVFRELYEQTRYNIFDSIGWKDVTAEQVEGLCALAVGHVNALGLFREQSATRLLCLAVLPPVSH